MALSYPLRLVCTINNFFLLWVSVPPLLSSPSPPTCHLFWLIPHVPVCIWSLTTCSTQCLFIHHIVSYLVKGVHLGLYLNRQSALHVPPIHAFTHSDAIQGWSAYWELLGVHCLDQGNLDT